MGGFRAATVNDAEWRRWGAKTKNIPMRSAKPVFDIIVELKQVGEYVVHESAELSVDALLTLPGSETPLSIVSHRWSDVDGNLWVRYETFDGSAEVKRESPTNNPPTRSARGWLNYLQQQKKVKKKKKYTEIRSLNKYLFRPHSSRCFGLRWWPPSGRLSFGSPERRIGVFVVNTTQYSTFYWSVSRKRI